MPLVEHFVVSLEAALIIEIEAKSIVTLLKNVTTVRLDIRSIADNDRHPVSVYREWALRENENSNTFVRLTLGRTEREERSKHRRPRPIQKRGWKTMMTKVRHVSICWFVPGIEGEAELIVVFNELFHLGVCWNRPQCFH